MSVYVCLCVRGERRKGESVCVRENVRVCVKEKEGVHVVSTDMNIHRLHTHKHVYI